MTLSELMRSGFHYCDTCQRVTEREGDPYFRCARCGSHKVRWVPGVGQTICSTSNNAPRGTSRPNRPERKGC